ncbi:peroxiredoxin family protein [Sphingobacterium yanglingense]|uniref:Thiol-disulfide isomerase/thioredoxin n=1 Tax=Sphingobacterium yanglingense TaxID=1437280 RepID=A0A4R6WGI2_9SPHI|nr:TlpA disulfide reductase family protein [Sphingobacterium yanglingense]TDQ79263.1 thiol-disulfide isomerase/thioredoxin [Sphingobacterium yanglingense]
MNIKRKSRINKWLYIWYKISPYISSFIIWFVTMINPVDAQEVSSVNTINNERNISLQIGDSLPESIWKMPLEVIHHAEGRHVVTLNDYRDNELIILDFWATWCGACIGSIQKYVKTDGYTDADIAFLGVTYQDKEEVTKFNERFKLNFPTIIGDTVLRAYFPYRIIPHIVVIQKGKVLTIAHSEILLPENVQKLKGGKYEEYLAKSDILNFDKTKVILDQKSSRIKDAIKSRTVIMGPISGLSAFGSYKKTDSTQRLYLTNHSLLFAMYKLLDVYWHNRIFLKISNEDHFDYFGFEDQQKFPYTVWLTKYGVGLESIAPLNIPKKELKWNALIALLNTNGYDFAVVEKEVETKLIYPKGNKKLYAPAGNVTIEELLKSLNYQQMDMRRVPIYLSSNLIDKQDRISIDLRRIRDDQYLQNILSKYGLKIKNQHAKQSIIEVTERRSL